MTSSQTISWQQMLDLFSLEVQQECHQEFWTHFKELKKVEDLVQFIYNFSLFRKRMNAWLTKHPREHTINDGDKLHPQNVPDTPAGNIREVAKLEHGENPEFPAASTLISVNESPEKGRFVVAAQDIEPGETLFLEDPFTSVLCDTEQSYCDFCCLPLPDSPARCLSCDCVSYCSRICLAEAQRLYHLSECGSTLGQHVGIARLGLRVALVAESLGFLSPQEDTVVQDDQKQQYLRVMNLLTHLDELSSEDKLHYTLTAVLLVMDQVRERGLKGSSSRIALVRNLGGRVLHHIAQMVCNGNAVTAYHIQATRSDGSMVQEQQVRVATAIFPSASLMNHSCDPNILTSYVGRTLIARATRHISKGEEVFNCYGPHFRSTKTHERKFQLQQQYFFKCACKPCSSPNDLLEVDGIDALMCPKCKGPFGQTSRMCFQCKHQLTNDQLIELRENQKHCADVLHIGDEKAASEAWNEAVSNVKQGLQLQQRYLHPKNRKIAQTHDFLAMLYARQGKYEESMQHLKQSLALSGVCFGELSVEVSGILDTLVDIAIEDLASYKNPAWTEKKNQALRWCMSGIQIVDSLLGPWHPRMQSLLTSQKRLQDLKMLTNI